MTPRAHPSHHPKRILGQLFCMGPKWCTMHCHWERNSQNCPFPLEFCHPAGGGPSHGHRQHAPKVGKDRACGSGDVLADRWTHTQPYLLQYFATAPAKRTESHNHKKRKDNAMVGEGSRRTRRVALYLETHCNIGLKRAFPTGVLDR